MPANRSRTSRNRQIKIAATRMGNKDIWLDVDTNRQRDPETLKAINHPKGPQGNKAQGVKLIAAMWDVTQQDGEVLGDLRREVASLCQGFSYSPLELYISELKQGMVPWMYLVLVKGDTAVKMQIMVRNMAKYPTSEHYLECHFSQGFGKKYCQTFRSLELTEFVKYFVNTYFDNVKDGGPRDNLALEIMRPNKPISDNPTSDELTPARIRQLSTEIPGGTPACKDIKTEVRDVASKMLLGIIPSPPRELPTPSKSTKQRAVETSEADTRDNSTSDMLTNSTPATSVLFRSPVFVDHDLTDADAYGEDDIELLEPLNRPANACSDDEAEEDLKNFLHEDNFPARSSSENNTEELKNSLDKDNSQVPSRSYSDDEAEEDLENFLDQHEANDDDLDDTNHPSPAINDTYSDAEAEEDLDKLLDSDIDMEL